MIRDIDRRLDPGFTLWGFDYSSYSLRNFRGNKEYSAVYHWDFTCEINPEVDFSTVKQNFCS